MLTYAGLDTGDPVSHWVQTRLGRVRLDDDLERLLASLQLLPPVHALGLAEVQHQRLRVLPSVVHVRLRVHRDVHAVRVVIRGWQVQTLLHITNYNLAP